MSLLALHSYGQKIEIDFSNQSLSEVFQSLSESNRFEYSIDPKLNSDCKITLKGKLPSIEDVLNSVAKQCPFSFEKVSGVYVIKEDKEDKSKPAFIINGTVYDRESGEPLPFANISIDDHRLQADQHGFFQYKSSRTTVQIRASHVGYFPAINGTTNSYHSLLKIFLQPKRIDLKKVVVSPELIPREDEVIDEDISINPNLTTILPGSNDNLVFNLLRMEPGILAAGEQTKDFFIWGSYQGQTQVVFDEMTLFSTASYDDEIGTVNPLLVKEIDVFKAGYGARYGDRVGGFVNITSLSGDPNKFHGQLNLNNQTANATINIPFKRSALQFGARKTFYPFDFIQKIGKQRPTLNSDFADLNLKYSAGFKRGGRFSLSLIGSWDEYTDSIPKKVDLDEFFTNTTLYGRQFGGSMQHSYPWQKIGTSVATAAYSQYSSNIKNQTLSKGAFGMDTAVFDNSTSNAISEFKLKVEHFLPATKWNAISLGVSYIDNRSNYELDSIDTSIKSFDSQISRIQLHVTDNIRLGPKLSFEPGLRVHIPIAVLNAVILPRAKLTYRMNGNWLGRFSWGMYNQFISQNTVIDQFNNYVSFWTTADDELTSKLRSTHYVAAIKYEKDWLTLDFEGYYKTTDGLIRFVPDSISGSTISNGKARSYGGSVSSKFNFKRLDLLLSYSIGRVEENFDYFDDENFLRAPHDQTHEVKGAAVVDLSPFYFSTTYVFGSGLPAINAPILKADFVPFYSRLDIAFMYGYTGKKMKLRTGFSIVNLLNKRNVRYNSFSSYPNTQPQFFNGAPISPTVFLNIGF